LSTEFTDTELVLKYIEGLEEDFRWRRIEVPQVDESRLTASYRALLLPLGQASFEREFLRDKLAGKPSCPLPSPRSLELPALHPLFRYDYSNFSKATWEIE
jgi:hypothetical protein